MQELRLVAVSEDGSYLVLTSAGRGTRFTLPVDDRLRAVVRGQFSRLGQYEIEVESPLRPKEIQARIRAGETAEEIAETAGIPVERVRWFEGPVLQEREYMAQQAQRVTVRRPGDNRPGPPLGESVEEHLGKRAIDLEEVDWDSRKCDDGTWKVRLSFFVEGRPHVAEWAFDPRRRHLSPLDDEAARLSSMQVEEPEPVADTVTPFVPRRPMKVVTEPPAEPTTSPEGAVARPIGKPAPDDRERPVATKNTEAPGNGGTASEPNPAPKVPDHPPAAPSRTARPASPDRPAPEDRPAPSERAEPSAEPVERPAAAAGGTAPPPTPTEKRPARKKSSARSKRASVPSWDEIMFGTRKPD